MLSHESARLKPALVAAVVLFVLSSANRVAADTPPGLPVTPEAPPTPAVAGQQRGGPAPTAPVEGGMGDPRQAVGGADARGNSAAAPAGTKAADPDKPKFDINWNNGVFIQSVDKRFSFHAGAALQYDYSWYSASRSLELAPGGTGKFNDGVNLRRGRMFFEGTLYEAVDYKFEIEFFNGFSPAGLTGPVAPNTVSNSAGPTDAWLNIKDVPLLGNVRIGNQKEWFSLEHLNNYRALEFLERSYLFDFSQATAFNNGFTPGISVFSTWLDDRTFTAVGVYKNESDLLGFGLGDGQYAVTGRLAALPVWMPDKQLFWHVGGAMSYRDPVNGQVQVRVRDNVRNAPFPLLPLLVNTGFLNASSQNLFNLETAAVWGPLTFQAEYTANIIREASVAATSTTPTGSPLGDLFFQGYYAEGLVLLTGESRTWNTKIFAFNRVVPKRPLKLKLGDGERYGFGAWELGVRYTYLDVSDKAVKSGRLDSLTLGVNWYLNGNAKIQFNYDYTYRGDTNNPAQGSVHALGIRSSFDF